MSYQWPVFLAFILAMLAVDLGLFNRKEHVIKTREALIWSAVWVGLSLLMNVGIYLQRGPAAGMAFLTGYVVEKALSVDNLFVFMIIFSHFRVPDKLQHRVLFWGVAGALVMRAIFIFAGIALLEHFHFVIYIFGALLVFTGVKLVVGKEKKFDPEKSRLVLFLRKRLPFADHFGEGKFFVHEDGKRKATLMLLVLVVVELTDLVFALDSVPAILAITTDSFLVFSSNVMAIMGLRSLYFALARLMKGFHYLKYGLAIILVFVGGKMLASDFFEVPVGVSLGVIVVTLAVAVLASWMSAPEEEAPPA